LQIVTSPVPPGMTYAMSATVEYGDSVSGGARAEVTYTTDAPAEGDTRYYHWQTYFPTDFNPADYWQIFTQWHQYISGGSPPLAVMAWGNQILLGNENNVYFYTGPLVLGVWHDFVVHVVWSVGSTVGGVEMWVDGQHVLPFYPVATLFAGDTIYLKQGEYRKDTISYNQTVYHCGMTVATTLADVLPAGGGSGTPDAGTATTDAGSPPPTDAGSPADAGVDPPADAGSVNDAGTSLPPDAGECVPDAGTGAVADAGGSGSNDPPAGTGETGSAAENHGCSSAGLSWAFAGLAALLARRRRSGTAKNE